MRIQIGTVAKPQGVKGEVKINALSGFALRFLNLKKVYLADKEFEIKSCSVRDNGVFVCFQGITDRDQTEGFRNLPVFADKEEMGELDEGEFYIDELIGCKIVIDGRIAGELKDVQSYGSADVFVADIDGKEVSFPFIDEVVPSVDLEKRTLIVSKDGLKMHGVYED